MRKRFGMPPYWRGGVPVERGQYPAVLEWRAQREKTTNPEIFQGWIADIESVLATVGLSLVTQQTGGGRIIYSAAGHKVAELRKTMDGLEGTVFSRPVGGPGPGAAGRVAAEEIRRSSTWLGYGQARPTISPALIVPAEGPEPEYHLAPSVTASRTELMGVILETTAETDMANNPYNPSTDEVTTSKRGLVIAGAGVLGAIATILGRGKLGVAGTAIAGVASAGVGIGGTVLAVSDKNRADDERRMRNILKAHEMPLFVIAPTRDDVKAVSTWSSVLTPADATSHMDIGQGYECKTGDNPYYLAEIEPQMQIMDYHVQVGPGGVPIKNPSYNIYEKIVALSSPDWGIVHGLTGSSSGTLPTAMAAGQLLPTTNWATADTVAVNIRRHKKNGWLNNFDDIEIVFYEEGTGRRLCTIELERNCVDAPMEGSDFYCQYLCEKPGFKIIPGENGRIPHVIVFNGVNNPILRGIVGGEEPPALSEAVNDAIRLPMATIQTIYRIFRTHQPETWAMASTPVGWAMLVAKVGRISIEPAVREGWLGAIESVFKVAQSALAIASVCYPPLAAVAPIAGAMISSIQAGFTGVMHGDAQYITDQVLAGATMAAWGRLQENLANNRGRFDDFTRNWDETFTNWETYVMGYLPPGWKKPTLAQNVAAMADSEFKFAFSKFSSYFLARPLSETRAIVPNTAFAIHKLSDYLPPAYPEAARTFVP